MTIEVPTNIKPYHRLIHIPTGTYPLTMTQIRQRENISTGPEPLLYLIQEYGYDIVYPTDRPTGDVVTEGVPELVNGYWMQRWDVRSYTEEEYAQELASRKQNRRYEFEQFFKDQLYQGVSYNLNGTTFHVQLRDVDRTNLNSIILGAQAKKANGIVGTVIPYRPRENTTIWLTPDQAIEMCLWSLQEGEEGYLNRWVFLDALDSATTFETIPEIPGSLFN